MSLENIENLAKNLVELSYEYERTKDDKLKKRMLQISENIKKAIEEEHGRN